MTVYMVVVPRLQSDCNEIFRLKRKLTTTHSVSRWVVGLKHDESLACNVLVADDLEGTSNTTLDDIIDLEVVHGSSSLLNTSIPRLGVMSTIIQSAYA